MTRRVALAALLAGAALAGCGSSSSTTSSPSSSSAPTGTAPATSTASHTAAAVTPQATPVAPGPIGPEGMPLEQGPPLGSAQSTSPGNAVDGVKCAPVEQLAYHIHARLAVYVDGQQRTLPPGIGLLGPASQQTPQGVFFGATQCYYWLHVHAADGVIHIESPTARIYTLGDFFDEWRQPLSANQVATAGGPVTAWVNGKRFSGDPRSIPLASHNVIQLDVGSPQVPFQNVSFGGSGL